eukprot:CAMPEP_0194478146 /NCGR_PEP_ID=MMETSP0253-20130528/1705_1 /TAXON_ID=2966 /ORGANISM="Noctiluca scintillans" /LENGTH=189 /DNA_ID=CAMNT_0039317209 /DNA_START=30 /DNA_END=599 /DNA_ORIENTATION=+
MGTTSFALFVLTAPLFLSREMSALRVAENVNTFGDDQAEEVRERGSPLKNSKSGKGNRKNVGVATTTTATQVTGATEPPQITTATPVTGEPGPQTETTTLRPVTAGPTETPPQTVTTTATPVTGEPGPQTETTTLRPVTAGPCQTAPQTVTTTATPVTGQQGTLASTTAATGGGFPTQTASPQTTEPAA